VANNSFLKLLMLGGLYLSQSLPVSFLCQAFPTFMRQQGASLDAIELLGLLALPWALKFLWLCLTVSIVLFAIPVRATDWLDRVASPRENRQSQVANYADRVVASADRLATVKLTQAKPTKITSVRVNTTSMFQAI
jgi:hypothetical protein